MGKQTMAACLLLLSAAAWAEGGCDEMMGKYQIVNKLADSDLLQEVAKEQFGNTDVIKKSCLKWCIKVRIG